MYHKLLKWSGIIGTTLMMLAIVGMLIYSLKKPLIYVRAEGSGQAQSHKTQTGQVHFEELTPAVREDADDLCIPMASGVTQEAIHIDTDYMNHIMTITVDGMATGDIADGVYGNLNGVSRIQAADWEDQLILMVLMEDSYEYGAILENQKLMLTLKMPRELYERVVVLDAGHGGADTGIKLNGVTESEFVLDIAGRVRELLAEEEIRVYTTRDSRENPDGAQRVSLANGMRADMYVSLHLAEREEYGISARYNGTYFTPALTNAELADLLVRYTAEAVNNRGIGLFEIEKGMESGQDEKPEEALDQAQVPAVYLELGAPSNVDEAALLCRDDYRQDLAQGIAQAILAAYEEKRER